MIPKDPVMLLSYINTKLRDHYSSLEVLCEDLNLDPSEVKSKLESINYFYVKEENQFK
jgi:hypothetical protein